MLSVTQGSSKVTLAYDKANRRTALTLANGVTTSYSYDHSSELTGLTYTLGSTTLGNLSYTYDADGRRNSIGGSYARTGLPAAVSSASYNQDNQLTQWGSTTLTYDLNGNMTNDGTNTYTWNARNQLASINSGTTASFLYDAFNRRQTKTIFGNSTSFLYDRINPVQELSGATVTANLVTGLAVDEIFSRTDSAGARYFVSDALRSTLALTDSTGTAETQYTYEPFGSTTVSGASTGSSYQYTGRENDGTGLYYYRARYYSPSFARFVREDPIRLAGGAANFYQYVFSDPLNFRDPTGKDLGSQNQFSIACSPSALNGFQPAPAYQIQFSTTAFQWLSPPASTVPPPTPGQPIITRPYRGPTYPTAEEVAHELGCMVEHCTASGQELPDAQENEVQVPTPECPL